MRNVTLTMVVLALLAAPVAQAGWLSSSSAKKKPSSSSANNNKDKACTGLMVAGTACTLATTGVMPVCWVVDAAALGCHVWVWTQKQD